jgi:hypothetical protein
VCGVGSDGREGQFYLKRPEHHASDPKSQTVGQKLTAACAPHQAQLDFQTLPLHASPPFPA